MKVLASVLITAAALLALQQVGQGQPRATGGPLHQMDEVAGSTYEHLATAIIEIERTEDELVKSILLGYHAAARNHLRAAAGDAKGRRGHLEAAATQIANIANEGDKRIQAVRQRLSKAGHTHNTDAVTKEDYMFVDSKEKKALVALSRKVAQLGDTGDVSGVAGEFDGLFARVIADE